MARDPRTDRYTENAVHLKHQIGNTYVESTNRFVVSFIVGYDSDDAGTAKDAADLALELTRDGGRDGTVWFVYDRETGDMTRFEQSDFDTRMRPCIRREYTGGSEEVSVYALASTVVQDEDVTVRIVRSMLENDGGEYIYNEDEREFREVFTIIDREAAEWQSNDLAI